MLTVESDGVASTHKWWHISNVHANEVTDASGTVVETLDYYPYGGLRIDDKVGSYRREKTKVRRSGIRRREWPELSSSAVPRAS